MYATDAQQMLDELFAEGLDAAQARTSSRFINKYNQTIGVILYGAGTLGKQALAGMRQAGIEPLAFVEDISDGQKEPVEGLPVLPLLESVNLYGDTALYLITILNSRFSYKQAYAQLTRLGCKHIESFLSLFWAYRDIFLPYYPFDLPENLFSAQDAIYHAFNLLSDNQSRLEFVSHLQFRLHLDFSALPANSNQPYSSIDFCSSTDHETRLIDLGAFDGDSIKLFLERSGNKFQKIWAIEPDGENFRRLNTFKDSLEPGIKAKIDCLNVAVADYDGEINFHSKGREDSRYCADSLEKVPCAKLDSLFANEGITSIKLDIEGMEQKALIGGRELIIQEKPSLAVSAYHCPDDIWQIPVYLKSLNKGYRLSLRTEGEDGMGVVCYAR